MIKLIIYLSVLVFFSLSNLSFAEDTQLEDLYGQDLYNAPTGIRSAFQSTTGSLWYEVTKEERQAYIEEWQDSNKKVLIDQELFDKDLADKAKQIKEAEKLRKAKERALAKVEADKLKAAAADKRLRDKQLADMRAKRERTLAKLKRMQKARTRKR